MKTTLLNPVVKCGKCNRENTLETFAIGVEETEVKGLISIRASLVFYADCKCGRTISVKYEANNLSELQADIYKVASSVDVRTIGKGN